MERVTIEGMPIYSEDGKIAGLSAYKISHIVPHLNFYKPSLRYPDRVDRIKSNVLRALCDRYPNVWPGLPEIAKKAKCSTAQARRVLRELELKDRLIVDINSRLTWRWPTAQEVEQGHPAHTRILESDNAGKAGGLGQDSPVQYFICDRRIYDIYIYQQECEAREKREKYKKRREHPNQGRTLAGSNTAIKGENYSQQYPNQGSSPAQSGEAPTPITGSLNQGTPPSPLIAEPTILITDHKNQPPPTRNENLWRRMDNIWRERHNQNLSKAGWRQTKALNADDDTLLRTWAYWLEHRNLDGLLHPLIMFAEESPETLAALQDHDQKQAAMAANARQVDESAKACVEWQKNLEWFTERCHHVREIDVWITAHPPPPMFVQSDDGMATVVYADSIIRSCKRQAEERAEKRLEERLERYGHGGDFCNCERCSPEFWAAKDRERDNLGAFEEAGA